MNNVGKDEDDDEIDLDAAIEEIEAAPPFNPDGYVRQVPVDNGDGSVTVISKGDEDADPEEEQS